MLASLKPGLKIRYGHIDEVSGGGCRRPVGGCCWGLRKWGDLQGHAGVDPASAETQVRGSQVVRPARYGLGGTCMSMRGARPERKRTARAKSVGCSVACLERSLWESGYRPVAKGHGTGIVAARNLFRKRG